VTRQTLQALYTTAQNRYALWADPGGRSGQRGGSWCRAGILEDVGSDTYPQHRTRQDRSDPDDTLYGTEPLSASVARRVDPFGYRLVAAFLFEQA